MRAQALPPPRSPDENPENPACEKPKRGPPAGPRRAAPPSQAPPFWAPGARVPHP